MCIYPRSAGQHADWGSEQRFLGQSLTGKQNGQKGLGGEWLEALSLDIVDEADQKNSSVDFSGCTKHGAGH